MVGAGVAGADPVWIGGADWQAAMTALRNAFADRGIEFQQAHQATLGSGV